ncbi:MAG: orotate phosphoribosyltransferase [Rickettsiales bacterium]|nr:orotate phosphoribosyltransferase [Rickettsiales bacterium]
MQENVKLLNEDLQNVSQKAASYILKTNSVLFDFEEGFTYTSGKKGPVYVDIRRLISFPEARSFIMDAAVKYLLSQNLNLDLIAGGETAGIPFAAFIADRLDLPMIYVRKKPKGVGRMAQIEGVLQENQKTIVVEDLCNFGGSSMTFIEVLRKSDASCNDAFVIFNYGREQAKQEFDNKGVKLHALCSWDDIFVQASKSGQLNDKQIEIVKESLNS